MKKIYCVIFTFLISASVNAQQINYDRIEQLADSIIDNSILPGMVIYISQGNNEWLMTKGISNVETGETMTARKEYRIGSVTKTFVNTVFLQLVDEDLISLDETLDKFYPEIKNSGRITMRMLGDMRSGMYNYSEEQGFSDSLEKDPRKKWTPQELIEISMRNQPYFEPGTGFHYSNTNTVLLGLIIEKITGNNLWSEIDRRITQPLGLRNVYSPVDPGFKGVHYNGYLDMDSLPGEVLDVTDLIDPSWADAAGQLISDIDNMKIYTKALAEGKLTSEAMHRERLRDMWSLQHPNGGTMKYGIGIFDFHGYLGHNGGIPGFTNISVHNPGNDVTVIILYNIQYASVPPEYLFSRIIQEGFIPG
jgi:D-alanyl-D-alanine carboxypeptidase